MEKIKSEYNNNKLKISAPTWNDEFNLSAGSYSVFDIQNYFEYIIEKHEIIADNPQNYFEYIIEKHEIIADNPPV